MPRLEGPRRPPASGGPPRKLAILCHGYGSNGADLISLAPYLARASREAAFAAPNAPEPVPGFPGGYQWFPLSRIDPSAVAAGLRRVAPTLDAFIDAELDRHGLKPSDCALIGFSQGAMLSLHAGLRRPEPLACVIAFSGLLAAPEALPAEIRSRPPVLLAHGDLDEVVPPQSLPAAVAGLAAAGVPAAWRFSRGSGHTIAPDTLDAATVFLRDAFAGRLSRWAAPEGLRRG